MVLPMDNVQWGKECDERRMKFTGSWFMVKGSSLGNTEIIDNTEILGFKIQVSGLAESAESAEIKKEPHLLMKLFLKV